MAISGKMANIRNLMKSDVRDVAEAFSQYRDKSSSLDKIFDRGKGFLKWLLPDILDPLIDPLAEESKDWFNLRPSKKGIERSGGTWSYGLPQDIIEGITTHEKETKEAFWEDMLGNFKSSNIGLDLGLGKKKETNIFNQLFPGGLGIKFGEGGQVPKYYGGGSVPSISEYFSMQGKTLNGSDTESLGKKMRRV